MTAHLRECEENAQYPDPAEHDCICAALRSREQRVLEQNARAFDVAVIKHLMQEERSAGVQAARDAVAALTYQDNPATPVVGAFRYAALAAIDALKGKQA